MKDPTVDSLLIGVPALLIVVGIFVLVVLEQSGYSNQVQESQRHVSYGQTLQYRCWQARNYNLNNSTLPEVS